MVKNSIWQNLTKEEQTTLKFIGTHCGLDPKTGFAIKNKSSREYTTIHSSLSYLLLAKHFLCNDTTIALKRYIHSDIIIIDIDQRNNTFPTDKIINKVLLTIGKPFYYEYNPNTKVYHLYYKFENYVSDNALQYITTQFKENYNFVIEPVLKNHFIRLPYSYTYRNNAFFYDNYTNRYNKIKNITQLNITFKKPFSLIIPKWIQKNNKFGSIIKKERNIPQINQNYTYGNGTRHVQQIRIAFNCIRNNESIDDFIRECHYWNDGTSKDMKLSEYKKNKMLTKIWDYCNNKYNSENFAKNKINTWWQTNDYFIYDEDYTLSEEEFKVLNKKLYCDYIFQNIGKIGGKTQKRFVSDAIYMFTRIKEKYEYDKKTKAEYKNETLKLLNNSVALSISTVEKMAKTCKITNYYKILKFIENSGLITPIEIGNYTYSYKKIIFCKHYKINSLSQTLKNYNSILYLKKLTQRINDIYNTYKERFISFSNFISLSMITEYLFDSTTKESHININYVWKFLLYCPTGGNNFFINSRILWYPLLTFS